METSEGSPATATAPEPSGNGVSVLVEPDLEFIESIRRQAGGSFKRCFQCGTCSATCELSPDVEPFPRKEMAWASWGRKDRLLTDVDVWLCHQCNDCSLRCPRGGRPGDVMAAVRQECVQHYSAPRFLGRWVAKPAFAPLLLAIPAALLALGLSYRDAMAEALGFATGAGERVVFSYSRTLPQWLVNMFFLTFTVLALIVVATGVVRFWRALKREDRRRGRTPTGRGIWASFFVTVKRVLTHERFAECGAAKTRSVSHVLVLFGFLGLLAVTLWVITARVNPLIADGFVYPFNFWSPWKMLANLGGLAIVIGGALMIRDRAREGTPGGGTSYPDGMLLATLLIVVLSGFATEFLHYIRLEPHRHAAYFVHLMFVFALLMYLPYSKFAHVIYRTTAMVYAVHSGRDRGLGELKGGA